MLQEIFQVYADRLLDLSSRNRLIYQSHLLENQQVDVHALDFLNGEPSFAILSELLGKRKKIALVKQLDARNHAGNHQSLKLKRLAQAAAFTEKESGEKSLYLAWPYVEGKLLNGQLVRAPLLLLPVELNSENKQWVLERTGDAEPMLNTAFFLAYQQASGLVLNLDWIKQLELPESFTDLQDFINQLYATLKDRIEIQFTSSIYERNIQSFPTLGKTLDQERLQLGKLAIKPYAVLSQFQTKISAMLADYQVLMQDQQEGTPDEFFSNRFFPLKQATVPREENLYTIFPLDGSQEKVIQAVRQGRSCVVEGPPGSGKSQLISNLAIDFMARGKRVLIVSQKRTALDVVAQRLAAKGFGEFLALVHDYRTDRKQLYQQLSQQIEKLDEYKKENSSLDAIQLERTYAQLCRKIDVLNEFFESYKKALFNTEECVLPIKELYLSSSLKRPYIPLTNYFRKIEYTRLDGFLRDFKQYWYFAQKFAKADSFWLHRVDFSSFSALVQQRMQDALKEMRQTKLDFQDLFSYSPDFQITHLFGLVHQKESMQLVNKYLNHEGIDPFLDAFKNVNSKEIDFPWLEQKFEIVKGLFSDEGIEWAVTEEELPDLMLLAIDFADTTQAWWTSHKLPWNQKKYKKIVELMEVNKLPVNAQGVATLIKRLENRLNLNHQFTLLSSKAWLLLPDKPFDFAEFNHFATMTVQALKGKIQLEQMGELGVFMLSLTSKEKTLPLVIQSLMQELDSMELKLQSWSHYFSGVQINHLMDYPIGEGLLQLSEELPLIFDELITFDKLLHTLDSDEVHLMELMLENYREQSLEDLQEAFLNGWKLAWIEHIEQKYPVLQASATPQMHHKQQELLEAVVEKWALASAIAQVRLKEQVYQGLEFNRLGNLLTYRDLKHQVSKQKRIWPIKQVIDSFESEIFRLTPCWLASPETVSAIFPCQDYFDLVIFDEASQCFAEKGIPAMLRGKQVVVAGDSQQLRPTDLYQARLIVEEEEIAIEVESLLDLVSLYFEKYWLQGHYRSEHLPLIHFSNQHFYDNKLEMLPTLRSINHPSQVIFHHLVEGIWEKQTNQVEAEKVVSLLQEIQAKKGETGSIGIIVFNSYQLELLEDLLAKAEGLSLAQVVVKTIEHVQGDEYDRVILALGYARNPQGKLIANFGLLSKQGGRQRLNVAISRARKQLHFISSISSKDFSKKQLENEGIALLHKYLGYIESQQKGEALSREQPKVRGYSANWQLRHRLSKQDSYQSFDDFSWIDLVEKDDGIITGAILTDDERLFGASSGKEPMVYHPLALQSKGWPYVFKFSRNYWLNNQGA
ncbi:MAG: AAA domain-containing protein [Mongoliitalea sp.]